MKHIQVIRTYNGKPTHEQLSIGNVTLPERINEIYQSLVHDPNFKFLLPDDGLATKNAEIAFEYYNRKIQDIKSFPDDKEFMLLYTRRPSHPVDREFLYNRYAYEILRCPVTLKTLQEVASVLCNQFEHDDRFGILTPNWTLRRRLSDIISDFNSPFGMRVLGQVLDLSFTVVLQYSRINQLGLSSSNSVATSLIGFNSTLTTLQEQSSNCEFVWFRETSLVNFGTYNAQIMKSLIMFDAQHAKQVGANSQSADRIRITYTISRSLAAAEVLVSPLGFEQVLCNYNEINASIDHIYESNKNDKNFRFVIPLASLPSSNSFNITLTRDLSITKAQYKNAYELKKKI